MNQNTSRIGNFTSSEIFDLLSKGKEKGTFGKPALTYIQECNMERRLGRSITEESNARPLVWGKMVEPRAFELLGIEYTLISKETIVHPIIPYWAGSPDGQKFEPPTVTDIKCPITLKSFCQLVDPLYRGLKGIDAINAIRDEHRDGEKYYWQLVSNAILTGSTHAELIVYVPYFSELTEIRQMAEGNPNAYWIWSASDDELPYLVDGGYYKNINIIDFEVPKQDIDLLTEAVLKAGKLLIDPLNFAIAERDNDLQATIVSPASLLQKL